MPDIRFHDISYAQGLYNMDADSNPIIFMKMSGFYYGSKTPYYDVQAARNYQNAVRANKLPGLYHFAGGADPRIEAEFFVSACSPLADGDVLILDYELTAEMSPPADPAGWCLSFVERVKELTGKYPLFYTYTSMLNQYKFTEVLKRCGLWIANYGVRPEADIPNSPSYIIHQFQGSPIDTNACFISLEQLRRYGYESPKPAPAPSIPSAPLEQAPAQPTPEQAPVVTPPVEQPVPVVTAPVDTPVQTGEIVTGPKETEPETGSVATAVIVRALWTFAQAAVAALAVGAANFDFTKASLIALLTGALAAGISAVKNIIVQSKEAK